MWQLSWGKSVKINEKLSDAPNAFRGPRFMEGKPLRKPTISWGNSA
jgi:hypothetical protein